MVEILNMIKINKKKICQFHYKIKSLICYNLKINNSSLNGQRPLVRNTPKYIK